MILRSILSIILLVGLFAAACIAYTMHCEGTPKYAVSSEGLEIPRFTEQEIAFEPFHGGKRRLPFTAAAIIDVDNDGIEELFLGGGLRQSDGLFRLQNDHFVDIADQIGLVKQGDEATTAAVVLDIDKNGYSDLIISRPSGIWLYHNDGQRFRSEMIEVKFPQGTVPLGVAIADLNRDGHFDMFVPGYRQDPRFYGPVVSDAVVGDADGKFFLNNGDNTFSDLTAAVGISDRQNILQAVFCDIDNDGLEDLVMLYAGGRLMVWKNRGDLLFESIKHPLSDTLGVFTGLGVGDYDDDGNIDFFIGNSGSTVPEFLAKAGIDDKQKLHSKWVLLKNKGEFSFEDDAERVMLADYELSRGAVIVDLNLDGLADLVVAQNHPAWPLYRLPFVRRPSRVFVQNALGRFAEITAASGIVNKSFATTPLYADFNSDGQPDIVHVNLAGSSKVFLSQRGENNFLKVRLNDSVQSLGAVVTVKTLSGKTLKRPFLVGKELCADSSHVLFFGLAKDRATEVRVDYANGYIDQKSGDLYNTAVVFD